MTTPAFDRRSFLATAAALAAVPSIPASALGQATPAVATPAPEVEGPFVLPPLPYAHEALEPAIDALTMRIHHEKHHGAYVKNLNAALKGLKVTSNIDALIADIESLPADKRTAVRNNGGGHANHSLFWTVLAPPGTGGEPSKELIAALDRDLGGLAKAKETLSATAMSRFGSGWSWLVVTKDKKLAIVSTPNQDSPLMGKSAAETMGTPIFGIDVWEHAYYLKYQNLRADYVKAVLGIANWNEISKRFAAAMA